MEFPYQRYATLGDTRKIYYPVDEEVAARWVLQTIEHATTLLSQLLKQDMPALQLLLVATDDWPLAPHDEQEENTDLLPYLTSVTAPPSLVIPVELDATFGEPTLKMLAFMLYQAITLAFLENDPRPWPEDYPLWADEWQLKFAALWLAHRLDQQQGVVNQELCVEYAEIFEPEADGKTPVTIRGFDWFEDTPAEDYLAYELLLEQFAADLLIRYDPEILPRFLALYRAERSSLLSDDVTAMLASALGPGGEEWLESLVYF